MIRNIGNKVFGTVGKAVSKTQEKRPLPVDLLESDEAYLAIFDAPGVVSSDVQVKFDDGTILVKVDRFRDLRDGFDLVFPGRGLKLNGRVTLPEDAVVSPDEATATLQENGTLHVSVPKQPPEQDDEETDSTESESQEDGETDSTESKSQEDGETDSTESKSHNQS